MNENFEKNNVPGAKNNPERRSALWDKLDKLAKATVAATAVAVTPAQAANKPVDQVTTPVTTKVTKIAPAGKTQKVTPTEETGHTYSDYATKVDTSYGYTADYSTPKTTYTPDNYYGDTKDAYSSTSYDIPNSSYDYEPTSYTYPDHYADPEIKSYGTKNEEIKSFGESITKQHPGSGLYFVTLRDGTEAVLVVPPKVKK